MDLEIINPYIMKIIIAAREEDSINRIASRISVSYGWTYKWVNVLSKVGVFKKTRMNVFLQKDNGFYNKTLQFIRGNFSGDISFRYSIIELFGIPYCFTGIDAVFVWTKGGYNIARFKGHYPIFVKIKESDRELFNFYTSKLKKKGGVYYKAMFVKDISCSYLDGVPVDSLKETIEFMRRYIYNFQPALEMVEEMYNVKTGVKYMESATNA